MTDPDQSGSSADEAASQQEIPAAQQETPAAQQETPAAEQETPVQDQAQATEADATEADTAESADETSQSAEDATGQETEEQEGNQSKSKKSKTGLLLGLVSGAFVLLLVLVGVAFFVWPGYAGPGSPDSKAEEAAAALASKDSGQLEQVSCHGQDGKPLAQISPEALQLVQSAKPAGEAQKILDTEAQAPVDLTLSAQGQTQTLPSTAVLGVSDHEWCLKGLAQRQ